MNDICRIKNLFKLDFDIGGEDIVFVSGSIEEGFGNKTSDIDIFVFTETKNRFMKEQTVNVISGNLRYDLEIFAMDSIKEFINTINRFSYSFETKLAMYDEKYLNVIHRMKFARVLYNESGFNSIYESINYDNFELILALKNLYTLDGYLEDLEGSCDENDEKTSCYYLFQSLQLLYDAYACIHGQTNMRKKWLYKKLRKIDALQGKNSTSEYLKHVRKINELYIYDDNRKCKGIIICELTYINKIREELWKKISRRIK